MPLLESALGAIQSGKSEGLSALYKMTLSRVLKVARSVLGSAQDAEEIACDVYMYVWNHSERYDPGRGSVMAWLAIITRNRAIDLIRKRRTTISLDRAPSEELSRYDVCAAEGPEQLFARHQANKEMHRVLARLSPVKRQLLALAFLHDLRHEDIASRTGLPVGTVKSHVRRGLRSMRSLLAPVFLQIEAIAPVLEPKIRESYLSIGESVP